MTTSTKIADKLYLISHSVSKTGGNTKSAEVPTNHLFAVDCSGSMYNESPKIREQLKKKLPSLIGEKDTLSIIWFSGRGEAGILFEGEPVATLKDLNDIYKQIDRWIKPMGLTGFKDPLVLAGQAAERLNKKSKGSISSLMFLSDGYDNTSVRSDILSTVGNISSHFSAATFVEYGYYADRALLSSMAEKAGGQLIFSENFTKYEPLFEAAMKKRTSGAARIEVSIKDDVLNGFAWSMSDNDLTTYGLDEGKFSVPQDAGTIYYLSPTSTGKEVTTLAEQAKAKSGPSLSAAYAALSLFSVRMQSNTIFAILKSLGDVALIEQFSKCFGKQLYSDYTEATKAAAFEPLKRFAKGYDPKKVPADDAFTVIDLLNIISGDDTSTILLDSPDFKVSRISRARQDSSEVLSEEEQKTKTEILAKLGKEKNAKKIAALQEDLNKLTAGKEALKFEKTPRPEGYPISALSLAEDRPNISVLVRMEGTVDLSKRLPENLKGKIPAKFPTSIFRNIPIVADGLVHMDNLPLRVSRATADKLSKLMPEEAKPARLVASDSYVEGVVNLRVLPVINRKMVKEVSAKSLFTAQYELEKSRASQKVYKAFRDEKAPKKVSASFKEAYGEEGAQWLKDQGLTDRGFQPNMVNADSTDVYMGKEITISLAGYSKLPSMTEFKKQADKGKFNGPGKLMKPYVDECQKFLDSKPTDEAFIKWADEKAATAIEETRKLIYMMAKEKFAIVVGQVWPKEFKDLSDNEMKLNIDGLDLECKLNVREIEIKI